MEIFLLLLVKLIPLYAIIGFGVVASRVLGVKGENISKIVIYFLVPAVFFHGVLHAPITASVLFLPLIVLLLCSVLCMGFWHIGGWFYKDASRNILAMTAGNGNTGYFGLPVALLLFDKETVGIYLMVIMGVVLFENTLGYYITARSHHTVRDCFIKLLKLPALYACALGVMCNVMGWQPDFLEDFFVSMRGAYTVLGMMIIGLGLAGITHYKLDWLFVALAFLAKFVAFPLIVLSLLALDAHVLHFLGEETYRPLVLLSIVPLAANTVVFATLLNAEPEKAATAVFLSTLAALLYVPLMAMQFL